MRPVSYKRHRFPPEVIRYAVWLYFRFALSVRDVADLMAERSIMVSYETVRCWTQKFGRQSARNMRSARSQPTATWHHDEMVVRISGEFMLLWRAVDGEGEVLDMLVQKRRDKPAALRLLRKLPKRHWIRPEAIITDGLRSYSAMAAIMRLGRRHRLVRLDRWFGKGMTDRRSLTGRTALVSGSS